jgi:hypothetical protein
LGDDWLLLVGSSLVVGLLERGVSTVGFGWVVTGVIGDFVWLILLENLVSLGG